MKAVDNFGEKSRDDRVSFAFLGEDLEYFNISAQGSGCSNLSMCNPTQLGSLSVTLLYSSMNIEITRKYYKPWIEEWESNTLAIMFIVLGLFVIAGIIITLIKCRRPGSLTFFDEKSKSVESEKDSVHLKKISSGLSESDISAHID